MTDRFSLKKLKQHLINIFGRETQIVSVLVVVGITQVSTMLAIIGAWGVVPSYGFVKITATSNAHLAITTLVVIWLTIGYCSLVKLAWIDLTGSKAPTKQSDTQSKT